jgi:RNA recognition motif-containing protein
MDNKIYVGNISYSITEEGLKDIFQVCGTVINVIIARDRHTKRPKGFGFVEYATPEEAQHAIECINGQSILDRKLTVAPARKQEDKNPLLKPITLNHGECIFCNKHLLLYGFENDKHKGACYKCIKALNFMLNLMKPAKKDLPETNHIHLLEDTQEDIYFPPLAESKTETLP